jgi:hypothetical protein
MALQRCCLCGRSSHGDDMVWLRGLKGAVCRPGHGCDRQHPSVGNVRDWLSSPDSGMSDADLDDILVDNPKH